MRDSTWTVGGDKTDPGSQSTTDVQTTLPALSRGHLAENLLLRNQGTSCPLGRLQVGLEEEYRQSESR